MIFLAAVKEPTMFLMLTDQDIANMRAGRTCYVDPRQTDGAFFNKVILSLHRNHEECKAVLAQGGHRVTPDQLIERMTPDETEGKCKGCQGVIKTYNLFEGMCICCWKEKADHYEALANIKGKS
jgi:hypothetical protein